MERKISSGLWYPFGPVPGKKVDHLDLFARPGEQVLYLQTFFGEGTTGMGFQIFFEGSGLLARAKCESGFYPPGSIFCSMRTGTFVVLFQASF